MLFSAAHVSTRLRTAARGVHAVRNGAGEIGVAARTRATRGWDCNRLKHARTSRSTSRRLDDANGALPLSGIGLSNVHRLLDRRAAALRWR